MTTARKTKKLLPARVLLATTAALVVSAAAHAQPAAITYPSVARATPTPPAPQAAATPRADTVRTERRRVATEAPHSVFVYETLGATPSIRLPLTRHTATAELPTNR